VRTDSYNRWAGLAESVGIVLCLWWQSVTRAKRPGKAAWGPVEDSGKSAVGCFNKPIHSNDSIDERKITA
jgi:hypothetical protein